MTIRDATIDDVPAVLGLIRELATYEREPDAVRTTEADLVLALFPDDGPAAVWCRVAEVEGEVVGMALWFLTFSTWTGQHGIWLEDLYVRPAQRGSGLGRALLASLARLCVERGWPRLEWTVLDWNTPAIDFYRALGAGGMVDWTTHRVTGEALQRLGTGQ